MKSDINDDQFSLQASNNTDSNTVRLWTVTEVAFFLRLKPETVRSLARRGCLPAKKIGKEWRFAIADLEKFLHC